MNPNWDRWVKASFAAFFKAHADSAQIALAVENSSDSVPNNDATFFELRVDGPYISKGTQTENRLDIDIEMMLNCPIDSNIYTPETWTGLIKSWCFECIQLKKLGNKNGDDQSVVGNFILRADLPRPVRSTQMGTKDPAIKVAQIVIEAHYWIRVPD